MEGAREINELHVPVNRDIRLTLTSEDVIHDFYVPAFRTKTDVLPGKYTTEWFRPTKIGAYHIFCAEYCGTKHSGMIGTVYVHERGGLRQVARRTAAAKAPWRSRAKPVQSARLRQLPSERREQSERALPESVRRCSARRSISRTGRHVRADESYIRESVLYPQAKIVAGYDDIMPTFKGLITEDGMLKLIEYVKSLGDRKTEP